MLKTLSCQVKFCLMSIQISCGIGGCKRTFRNYSTFRNHVSDWHSVDPNPTNVPCDSEFADVCHPGSSSGGGEESNSEDATDVESNGILGCLQQASASFLIGLKEKYKLTQTALQGMLFSPLSYNCLLLLYNQLL